MHGCNGKMGQVITKLVKDDNNAEIVAGIDKYMGIVSCEGETRFLHESENMYFTEDLAKVIYNSYLNSEFYKSIAIKTN